MVTRFYSFSSITAFFLTMTLLVSCAENAGVGIISIENISDRSVVINGTMEKRVGILGFCISDINTNPLCSDSRIISPIRVETDNTFSAQIKGLKPATKYYCRAFSIHGKNKLMSSKVLSFTTDSVHMISVDLGLSVLWSNCNLGADMPEFKGDYLSWIETCNLTEDSWRMPTSEEYAELCTQCNWKWTTLSGTQGYEVKSSNGNSIFLPAAGAIGGGEKLFGLSTNGAYWTCDRSNYSHNEAMCLKFTSGYMDLYRENEKYGFSIRLVRSSP